MLNTRNHGVMDIVMSLILIASPWVFGFAGGGVETWLPVVLGASTLAYSMLTNYELGLVKVIPMPVHLLLDAASGILLAASPFLFGFSEAVWMPHVILGLLEVGVAAMTHRHSTTEVGFHRRAAA